MFKQLCFDIYDAWDLLRLRFNFEGSPDSGIVKIVC